MWQIRYGLGGGFGGMCEWENTDAINEDQASQWAFQNACEEYEAYEGLHGLRDVSQIEEEEEVDEDEAYEIYCEERDSWLDYDVREVKDEIN